MTDQKLRDFKSFIKNKYDKEWPIEIEWSQRRRSVSPSTNATTAKVNQVFSWLHNIKMLKQIQLSAMWYVELYFKCDARIHKMIKVTLISFLFFFLFIPFWWFCSNIIISPQYLYYSQNIISLMNYLLLFSFILFVWDWGWWKAAKYLYSAF